MTKQEILEAYRNKADELLKTVDAFTEEQFFKHPQPEKWSAAQNVEHLVLVAKPMIALFANPKVMAEKFGLVAKSTELGYNDIAKGYSERTGGRAKAPERLVPQTTEPSMKAQLDKFNDVNEKLLASYGSLTNEQAATHQIPHPFIGNLNVNEFMHFMAFHLDHHHKHIANALKAFQG